MTHTQNEELQAIMYAQVPEIPAAEDKNTPIWIFAIAKCLTYSCRETFAIVRMNYGKPPYIVRAFNTDGVAKILSVHPYKFLDNRFVPKLETKEAVIEFLAKAYDKDPNYIKSLKKADRMKLFYDCCIQTQLANEKEQTTPKDNENGTE